MRARNVINEHVISEPVGGHHGRKTLMPTSNYREVIRLPDCKSGVAKQSRKRRTGALPALPTILRLEPEHPRRFQAKDVLHRLGEGGLPQSSFQLWTAGQLSDS